MGPAANASVLSRSQRTLQAKSLQAPPDVTLTGQ